MRPGPSTYRPHVAIEELAKVMATRDLPNVLVTTSAGELIAVPPFVVDLFVDRARR